MAEGQAKAARLAVASAKQFCVDGDSSVGSHFVCVGSDLVAAVYAVVMAQARMALDARDLSSTRQSLTR